MNNKKSKKCARNLFKTFKEFELAKRIQLGLTDRPSGWRCNPICEKCDHSYYVYGCELNCSKQNSHKYCSYENNFKYFKEKK